MRPKKVVTLANIAEKTGVSIVTVSNALAGRSGVSPEMKKKIEECAKQLGYIKNSTGYQENEETVYISVLAKTGKKDGFGEKTELFIRLLKDAAEKKNVKLSAGTVHSISKKQGPDITWLEKEQDLIRNDGILLCGDMTGQELRTLVDFFKVPAAGWGFMHTLPEIDYLMDDGFRGICHAVRHVKECGASDILYVTKPDIAEHDRTDRLLGFYNAMFENGLMDIRKVSAPHTFEEHSTDCLRLRLTAGRPPEAVVCSSDETAAEVKTVLSEAGYDVPGDILVTGYRMGISTDPEEPFYSSCVIPLDIHAGLCLDLLKKRILRGGKPKGVRMIECCFAMGESTRR